MLTKLRDMGMRIYRYKIATLTGTNKVISAKVGIHKIFFKMFKHNYNHTGGA